MNASTDVILWKTSLEKKGGYSVYLQALRFYPQLHVYRNWSALALLLSELVAAIIPRKIFAGC